MAKVIEESITIKLSKLVSNKDEGEILVDDSVVETLEQAANELIQDQSIVVEAEHGGSKNTESE